MADILTLSIARPPPLDAPGAGTITLAVSERQGEAAGTESGALQAAECDGAHANRRRICRDFLHAIVARSGVRL
jgi:hypothetical protein